MSEENTYLVKVIATNGPDKGKSIVIDLYDIADSIGFRNAAHFQSLKKMLRGGRADKSWKQDMEEAIKSLHRAIEREEALEANKAPEVPQETSGVPYQAKVGDKMMFGGVEHVCVGETQTCLPTFEDWCIANVPDWDNGGSQWYDATFPASYRRLPQEVFDSISFDYTELRTREDSSYVIYSSPAKALGVLRDALVKLGKVRA